MTRLRLEAFLLPVLAAACVTTATHSRMWGAPPPPPLPDRLGRVEWIRETVQRHEGNPAGGAAVGALVGGLLGHAVTGHSGGAVVGAVGGAVAGASASQGAAESRTYEIAVRFEDGGAQTFLFGGWCPFGVGDLVAWTARGLERRGGPESLQGPPLPGWAPPPPTGQPPPPPTAQPPPPVAGPQPTTPPSR
jgi:outer membrane lipoprotein SlyB